MLAKIVIDRLGNIIFYNKHGDCHRIDGSAFEDADGNKEWWIDGKCHRLDGPAVINADGSKGWFINDKPYSEEEFNEYVGKLC